MIPSPLHPSLTCLEGTRALWTGSTASPLTAMLATQPGHTEKYQKEWSLVTKCCQKKRPQIDLTLKAVHGGYLDGQLAVPGRVHAA